MEENINIRNAQEDDRYFILGLNETNVEVLSPMDDDKFDFFMKNAELMLVAEVNGARAAFLIALREDVDAYTSENYRWFKKNYGGFLYVDRIVIDEHYRGAGLGKKLYEYVFEHAKDTWVQLVTAEVDTIPYNGPSLKFHEAMGFREVDTQKVRGGKIEVSLQVKQIELPEENIETVFDQSTGSQVRLKRNEKSIPILAFLGPGMVLASFFFYAIPVFALIVAIGGIAVSAVGYKQDLKYHKVTFWGMPAGAAAAVFHIVLLIINMVKA